MGESIFEKGLKLDVTKHIEKKGRFNYLSWAWAVQELRQLDSKATWETMHFSGTEGRSMPYMHTDAGCFVEVLVSLSDGTKSQQIHPVLDNSNKTLVNPNAFQINTSIQRCLVKAIALASGIGLHIYAGEDLPPESDEKKPVKEEKSDFYELLKPYAKKDRIKFDEILVTFNEYGSYKDVLPKEEAEVLKLMKEGIV